MTRKHSMTEPNPGLPFLPFGLIILVMLFGCGHTNPASGSVSGTITVNDDEGVNHNRYAEAASTSKEYSGTTEFSVIWYPNSMEFALAKEDLVHKILDAPFTIYNRFSLDEVFRWESVHPLTGCPIVLSQIRNGNGDEIV